MPLELEKNKTLSPKKSTTDVGNKKITAWRQSAVPGGHKLPGSGPQLPAGGTGRPVTDRTCTALRTRSSILCCSLASY